MNKALFGALLVIVTLAACSKPSDIKSVQDDIVGTWKRTSGKYTYRSHITNKDTTIDYWTPDSSCRKDDALEFKSDFKGLLHLGNTVCNAGDPESIGFHWEITSAGAGIRIYDAPEYFPIAPDVNGTFAVFTSTAMTVNYKTVLVNDITHMEDTVRITDVFRKQ